MAGRTYVLADLCDVAFGPQSWGEAFIVCTTDGMSESGVVVFLNALNQVGCRGCDYCGGGSRSAIPIGCWTESEENLRRDNPAQYVRLLAEWERWRKSPETVPNEGALRRWREITELAEALKKQFFSLRDSESPIPDVPPAQRENTASREAIERLIFLCDAVRERLTAHRSGARNGNPVPCKMANELATAAEKAGFEPPVRWVHWERDDPNSHFAWEAHPAALSAGVFEVAGYWGEWHQSVVSVLEKTGRDSSDGVPLLRERVSPASRREAYARAVMVLKEWVVCLRQEANQARVIGNRPIVSEVPASPVSENPAPEATEPAEAHPDGPVPPCWLWFGGRRHRITSARSWALLAYFWKQESAAFEDLQGPGLPWPDPVEDKSISPALTRFKNEMPDGFPWVLAVKNRYVYRVPR